MLAIEAKKRLLHYRITGALAQAVAGGDDLDQVHATA